MKYDKTFQEICGLFQKMNKKNLFKKNQNEHI